MNNILSHKTIRVLLIVAASYLMLSSFAGIAAEETVKDNKVQVKTPEIQATTNQPAIGSGISREKSFPKIESGQWTGPKLPDGQPDISGHWSNTIANHNNFTDPQGGIPNDPATANKPPLGPQSERAPSRVSDPADGQVPLQPWALEEVNKFQVGFHNPTEPKYIEPLARCAPAGIPKSLYWHGYEVAQYPGYIVFFFDSGTRIVHLDGKPHLSEKIKLWNADSRGHWEGNTLIVDVKNHNGKALFGRSGEFISENGTVQEKYIFSNDRTRYNYVATFTDPTVYTKPFTVTIPARKWTEKDEPTGWHFGVTVATHSGKERIIERHERICAENNGGFGLGAARK
jgi:hypothetical protein